jgi:flagellar protein FliJ
LKSFRLGTLLKLNEHARDQRQRMLADALHADSLLQQRIDQVQMELDQVKQQTSELVKQSTINPDAWGDQQRYRWILQSQKVQLLDQQGNLQQEIERRKQALMESDREVKKLEKMRERDVEQQRQHQLMVQQKELDDLAPWKAYASNANAEINEQDRTR